MEKKLKRPRDPIQLAKLIGDIAIGHLEDKTDDGKDPAAVALGRKGGLKGGPATAQALTKKQRTDSARNAITHRWSSVRALNVSEASPRAKQTRAKIKTPLGE